MARREKKSSTQRQPEVIVTREGIPLRGSSGMRTIPRVFEQPKERLHDARGRPSSKDLIRREAQQRVAAGTLPRLPQLNRFGRVLSAWLRETYPDLPQMTPRVVENVIRDIWKQRKKNI
jgi:hypothetical protein